MGRIIFGFIAAVLAVLLVHQPIILGFKAAGMLPPTATAYNMAALATAPPAIAAFFKTLGFAGFPVLLNNLFWGGLWGSLFGLIHEKIPGGLMIVKGLIFGLVVVVLSNWIAIPLIKGTPIFAGGDPMALVRGAIILGGFGMATALFYSFMRRD